MSESGTLICWNCNQRTKQGVCIHCGVQLSDPDEVFTEDKETEKKSEKKHIVEIRRDNLRNIRIDVESIEELISEHFEVKEKVYQSHPIFIIKNPGSELEDRFNKLIIDSEQMIEGFKPKIEKVSNKTDDLKILFVYDKPSTSSDYRNVTLLGIFTVLSIFLAGIYNFNMLSNAQGRILDGISILNIVLNLEVVLNGLYFTVTLVFILLIKDYWQIYRLIRANISDVVPFYIPAPPIFELGTVGSIYKKNKIHLNRREMFKNTFWGPVIGWLVSIVLLVISLPMATKNTIAAESYAGHSIIANGSFEPIGLTILTLLGNFLGLTDLSIGSPLTLNYIFHPITLGALAGFYICGINMLPASHLNGGYTIRSILGKKWHRYLSYLTILAFFSVNWLLATFLLFIHEALGTPDILNNLSSKPKYHKLYLVILFIIALLSFPLDIGWIKWLFF